jgi:hypothetical protein
MDKLANRQNQFSLLFRKHGRIIKSDYLPSDQKSRFDGQFEFYNKLEPYIYTGMVENISFNAIACKKNFEEFIAIYHGAFTQLTLYAYLIFSDPNSFPDIGDVSGEKLESQIIDLLKKGEITQALKMRFLPFDAVRRNAAERLAECACLILFYHEVGHIRGCHVDLLFDEFEIIAHKEFNFSPLSVQESLVLRTLELEADTVALVNSLNIWRRLTERSGVHKVEHLRPTQIWLIAAELLFSVMSLTHSQLREGQLPSHPSILTRYYNIWIGRIMQGEDEGLKNELDQKDPFLILWFIKQGFSSSLLDYFNKESINEPDLKEWFELQAKLETLYPKLELYQEAREKRLSK